MSVEPQLHDTVFVNGHPLRIVALSEDHGTKLSDGRWVCASKFVPVTRAAWRYEATAKPVSARETLTTTLTNLLARTRNGRMDAHRAEAERMVDEVLREQAHELARNVRTLWVPRPPGESADYVRGLDDGLDKAADLIKTEVP